MPGRITLATSNIIAPDIVFQPPYWIGEIEEGVERVTTCILHGEVVVRMTNYLKGEGIGRFCQSHDGLLHGGYNS